MLKEQAHSESDQRRKQRFQKLIENTLSASKISLVILAGMTCLYFTYTALFSKKTDIAETQEKALTSEAETKPALPKLSNSEIKQILQSQDLLNSDTKNFNITFQNKPYTIVTSLNIPLQQLLIKQLNRLKKLTRGKPQRIAIVVMDADSGNILALTGFDLTEPDTNPCFKSNFPAASVFKIITAAAAVEELGFTPHTPLYFNGSKYTLYKRQLKDVKNKYTTKILFKNAFAESVNPVFGKIGRNRLGNIILEEYSNKFEFNRDINSELVFEPSRLEITDNPYKLAEIGCGFNNTTTISPVFGAMISSTIINNGKRVAPAIVEKIVDSENNIIYDKQDTILAGTVTEETASVIQSLMQKTIETGTARKTFRGYNRDKILSKLVIGGKTGSIYNREHTIKYDWFTGFAKTKDAAANGNSNKIAMSIVVGHGDYIGKRACQYSKMIIKEYYKNI
jgi:penicillin-binding protein A